MLSVLQIEEADDYATTSFRSRSRRARLAGEPPHVFVLDGVLEHKDSMGSGSLIRPGDVQRMTAGTGVTHSEFNHSQEDVDHFHQIWILLEREGLDPSYEQTPFSESERLNTLRLIASRNGNEDSVTVHQDVDIYSSILEPGKGFSYRLRPDSYVWVAVARGSVAALGESLEQGDAAAISSEELVEVRAAVESEHFSELRSPVGPAHPQLKC